MAGIKCDRWIRRMAIEHGMIEPFADRQVREGVISYGLSSYGYDLRVADEFKIFTNDMNAMVDPKQFNPQSFVDFKGPACIIPPNSFALARTYERLKIPRNVMTVCLGKSTYARCFQRDTRVTLVDGSAPTLEEMAHRAEAGELFWGYSLGEFGRIVVTLLDAPRYIGRDSLIELTLDNGEPIECTPDHEFILRDGRTLRAADLRPGDSLMPLYRHLFRGYEMVYQPVNGHLHPTHRLADEWNVRNGLYADVPGTHRHHRDRDRRNNMPWNLERLPASEHIRLHNQETFGEDFDPAAHSEAIRPGGTRGVSPLGDSLERLAADSAWCEHHSHVQRERAVHFWRDEAYGEAPGSIRGAARLLGCDRSVFRRFAHVIAAVHGRRAPDNHKVVSVRDLPGDHDVYCLTVPEAGNFALAAGVFVLNCGIILNVTPLEPEWEGYATLEISNTTPLPAKIYSNEGICQLLFFEGDDVCEVSYADKKGKYQGQVEVTLPKV